MEILQGINPAALVFFGLAALVVASAAGAQGFIAKPVNRRSIVDRVAEALRRPS